MRITQNMLSQQFLYNLTNDNQRMANLQEELSTGKSLNQASDNPLAVSEDMSINATISETTGYQSTISDSQTWMNDSSTAIQGILTTLQSVQTTVLQSLNTTNQSSASDSALSVTAQQYMNNIQQTIDSKLGDRYLFGGTAVTTAPSSYTFGTGATPTGATSNLSYLVASSLQIAVNVTASSILLTTPAGASANLKATLSSIVTDLAAGSTASLQTDLSNLSANMDQITNYNADLGTRVVRVKSLQNQMDQYANSISNEKGVIEDANMAQVITQFNTDQNVYEAALKMGSQVLLPSLVSYLPS